MAREPDPIAKGISYGCGALFGLFISLAIGLYWFDMGWIACLAVTLVVMAACSFLAGYLGDDFWTTIARALLWWL